jgi:hypothetical protein
MHKVSKNLGTPQNARLQRGVMKQDPYLRLKIYLGSTLQITFARVPGARELCASLLLYGDVEYDRNLRTFRRKLIFLLFRLEK